MAKAKVTAAAATPKAGAAKGAAAAKAATLPPPRVPTWQQRLAVAVYIYFIPVFVALNVLMLLSKWTAIPWLM